MFLLHLIIFHYVFFFFYKNVLHLATIYIYIYIYFLNAFITIKKYIFLLDLPQWFYHGFYGRKAARIMGCYTARWRRPALQRCIAASVSKCSKMDKFFKNISNFLHILFDGLFNVTNFIY